MIVKYNSLKETIDATTAFVSETREADITRTSPEKILNLFISANRFGREAIAACCRKLYGPEYLTSNRYDYVVHHAYGRYLARHYSNSCIEISWKSFTRSYAGFIALIGHEIAHDVGHRHGHDEIFWQQYYRNCQGLGLISSDIEYKDGMIEDKHNVRIMGYGSIIGLTQYPEFTVSLPTLENRVKAMLKHDVFTYDNISNNYRIKQDFMPLALEICREYQVRLDRHQCADIYRPNTDFILKSIDEPWLDNPSDNIFDPSILKCITRNDINFCWYIQDSISSSNPL